MNDTPNGKIRVRTLFLSDLHLGFRYANPEQAARFLDQYQPDQLYVLGDFIDGWCWGRKWSWNNACSDVVSRITNLAAAGTRVRVVAGNHDQFLRTPLIQLLLGQIGLCEVGDEFQHQSADGRSFLVLHGDQFDPWERAARVSINLISLLYDSLLAMNALWSRVTLARLQGEQSLIRRIRKPLQAISSHIASFRMRVARYARWRGFNGVICGHIHEPELAQVEGVLWCNTGDWIENCSAVIEHHCGTLELVRAPEIAQIPVFTTAS
jgi:UDP-2,3-diacylglucosamine pyrophosphatase LpxH